MSNTSPEGTVLSPQPMCLFQMLIRRTLENTYGNTFSHQNMLPTEAFGYT